MASKSYEKISTMEDLVKVAACIQTLKYYPLVERDILPRIRVDWKTNTALVYTPTRVFKGSPQYIGTYFLDSQQVLWGYNSPWYDKPQKKDLVSIIAFAIKRVAAIPELEVFQHARRVSLPDSQLLPLLRIGASICGANFIGMIQIGTERKTCVFVHDLVEQDPRVHSDLLAEF